MPIIKLYDDTTTTVTETTHSNKDEKLQIAGEPTEVEIDQLEAHISIVVEHTSRDLNNE